MSPVGQDSSPLQTLVLKQEPGATLSLPPGEFFGQVTIDKPLTIVGKGKSTWIGSRLSPTVRITCSGVRLQNLMVECTAGRDAVTIEAEPGANPVLENIEIKGLVVGVVLQDIKDDPTKISFVPPPPMSPSDSGDPVGSSTSEASANGPVQPSALGMPPQGPSAGRSSRYTHAIELPASLRAWMMATIRDPMKAFLIGGSVVAGIALVLHMGTGMDVTKQIEEAKQLSKQADADNSYFVQAIDRLKAVVSHREKENESLREDRQRLEQEAARLKEVIAQKEKDNEALRAVSVQRQRDIDILNKDLALKLNRAETEKSELSKEIHRLRMAVVQKEKENETLRTANVSRQSENEGLRKDKQRLEQEIDRLKLAAARSVTPSVTLEKQSMTGQWAIYERDADTASGFGGLISLAFWGNPVAQYRVGLCYYAGSMLGCPVDQDEKKGLAWLEKASSQGHEEARNILRRRAGRYR